MSRQPVPGEVWTNCGCRYTAVGPEPTTSATPQATVWVWRCGGGYVAMHPDTLTPPPELPPAELVAKVGRRWINVYPDGHADGGCRTGHAAVSYPSTHDADAFAASTRVWLVHPDGRWQKCNGKEVIGEPVEVPR